jgi:hypothetical protein
VKNTSNLNNLSIRINQKQPVISNTQAEFFSSLQGLNVAFAGVREALQPGENARGRGSVEGANVRSSQLRPKRYASLAIFELSNFLLSDNLRSVTYGRYDPIHPVFDNRCRAKRGSAGKGRKAKLDF